MHVSTRFLGIFVAACSGWLLAGQLSWASEDLLAATVSARESAIGARAPLLAPESFENGDRSLARARADSESGRTTRLARSAKEATAFFENAVAAARRAEPILESALRARSAASEAGAPGLELPDWIRAEEILRRAAVLLERGDDKGGAARSEDAANRYRQSELLAIKLRLLSDTKALIADARDKKVHRYAPETLSRAESLVAEAEAALESDRYDTDKPRALALEARYEVRHAFDLARRIETWRREDGTAEDLILEMEEPLRRVAANADIAARFDQGPDKPAEQLIEKFGELEDRNQRLMEDVEERTQQVFALEQEVSEAYERLGGVSEQRQVLELQLRRQEMDRQRLGEVERLFSRDEARVLRQGDDVMLRLYGLGFSSGSAEIPAASQDLMKRLETAIRLYPESTLTLSGHTDSFGGDKANFELSRKRAESVRSHLLRTMRIPASRVSAVGYGETRPVANNQTAEGRARNRRIDVLIQPAD
jgi:outer membrane protein OmpA-like peptidoglycan-associated protein